MWVIFLRPGGRCCSSVAMTFLTFRGYKLADGDAWEHNVRIDLRPNPDYHGNRMPHNKGLRFEFYASLKQLHLAVMDLTKRVERLVERQAPAERAGADRYALTKGQVLPAPISDRMRRV
jgi:hypothetical protein